MRRDRYLNTSIFLNSVHLASSALSGLTRLILGACGIVRVLAERLALANVLFKWFRRRRRLINSQCRTQRYLFVVSRCKVQCVGGVTLTFMTLTLRWSIIGVPRQRRQQPSIHGIATFLCTSNHASGESFFGVQFCNSVLRPVLLWRVLWMGCSKEVLNMST